MQYSPTLKKAMSEIKDILSKYDIAGSVILHTPGFGEHDLKINPSYSAATFIHTPEGSGFKIKVDSKEVGKKKANELMRDTTNMFHLMSTLAGQQALMLLEGADQLDKYTDAKHYGIGGTSHQEQNN